MSFIEIMIVVAIGVSASAIIIGIASYLKERRGVGKIILIMGIALLLTGIGIGIYIGVFSSPIASSVNTIPAWFGNVIAVTFAILGIVLIVLGARELGFLYFDSERYRKTQVKGETP